MDFSWPLIKAADTNAFRAAHSIVCPVGVALLRVYVPLEDTRVAREIWSRGCHVALGNRPRGAMLRTDLAGFAEFHDSERTIGVVLERQVGYHLTEAESGTELFRYKETHPAPLTQSGGDR